MLKISYHVLFYRENSFKIECMHVQFYNATSVMALTESVVKAMFTINQ